MRGDKHLASSFEQVIENSAEQLGAQGIKRRHILEHSEKRLAVDLDEALELLSKESARVDVYADTYSPDRSERDSDRLGKDPFMKWAGIGFCAMMACLGISMLVHSVFQIGFCSKWFI